MLTGCTIGDGALVGMGATILNGARIGAGALIGAGGFGTFVFQGLSQTAMDLVLLGALVSAPLFSTVAARLLGRPEPYRALPWFWSDQGPRKLQIAGLCEGWDDTRVLRDAEGAVDTVLVFRAGRLIAVETVNQAGRHMAARKLLAGAPHGGGHRASSASSGRSS